VSQRLDDDHHDVTSTISVTSVVTAQPSPTNSNMFHTTTTTMKPKEFLFTCW